MPESWITISGARVHNLKGVSCRLPRNKLIVITGRSGSGKSSLAFDTIYAEGQRKYVESLSAYARQFLDQMQKPEVDHIEGLSPAIAIEQRTGSFNPRSTIATTTEIYDFLRLLFAHVGQPHCPETGKPMGSQTVQEIVDQILSHPVGTPLIVLAPVVRRAKGEFRDVFEKVKRQGFVRVRVDGVFYEVDQTQSNSAENPLRLDKSKFHSIDVVVDRLLADPRYKTRLTESVETALKWGSEVFSILSLKAGAKPGAREIDPSEWTEKIYSTMNYCPESGISLEKFTPRHFSFNSPEGACPRCHGLGQQLDFDADFVVPNPEKTLNQGAIAPWRRGGRMMIVYYKLVLKSVCAHYGIDMDTPWEKLPADQKEKILRGSGEEPITLQLMRKGVPHKVTRPFEGVIPQLARLQSETDSEFTRKRLQRYQSFRPCQACQGARLKKASLAVTVGERNIIQVTRLTVRQAAEFLDGLQLNEFQRKVADEILKEVRQRLGFLIDVGLDYLTLDRENGTLSGGEAQRIKLATQIGTKLAGVIYVLDEPSIGLHQRDNERLIETLRQMRDLGNTVIVVEHDEDTMRAADWLVDLGPGAGVHGGEIVAEGAPADFLKSKSSLTAQYLRGELGIPVPKKRGGGSGEWLRVIGARENNLKNVTVGFPLGQFTCVTGVSGSGKSTLVDDVLRRALQRRLHGSKDRPGAHDRIEGIEHIDKVIVIDQSPLGRTPRSNPVTYLGVFTQIRNLFAQLPTSKVRGYGSGRFSFNVKGGRCEKCMGDGLVKIEMHFLADVYVTCSACGGKRYNRETLEITYKGMNIADVLNMTVDEAVNFFRAIPQIYDVCLTLAEVGLGYIGLGQSATTLSGGEAQRIKLAAELSRKQTGRA
ncbi:MAG: excinuclease ABC subunit UvrA, partial [Verrucomicrobiae bacterium]|nr:excinuclease ABC subunit UvrA [Verrucomicrobiae bacterium]